MITPPVAIASYAAASLAGASPIRTAWESMRFGWPAFVVPFLFVFSPGLLLKGAVGSILLSVVTAIGGVWLASIGLVGHLSRPLPALTRILFILAGVGLLMPFDVGTWAVMANGMGAVLAVLVLSREYVGRVKTPRENDL